MKRARVACLGGVHDATEEFGMARLADGRLMGEVDVVWLPPIMPTERARTIFAMGHNYADQTRELAFDAPLEPDLYLKSSNALIGHRGHTRRPADATYMHCACELAVVIGRTARRVTRADAYEYVAGYSIANDYVVRDYVDNKNVRSLRGSSRDECTALGPWLTDSGDVRDPMNLRLRTWVNGAITQESSTRDMVFDIRFLIAHISDFMTLSRGDIILTGTPEGSTGIHDGDEVITEIEGLGRLFSTIVGEEPVDRGTRP